VLNKPYIHTRYTQDTHKKHTRNTQDSFRTMTERSPAICLR